MEDLPPKLVQQAVPLVAMVSDVPYLEMLATQLGQAAGTASAARAAASGKPAVPVPAMRYVVRPLSHQFDAKRKSNGVGRAHLSTGLENGVAVNILKRNWLDKHHNRVPSVIIPVVDVDSASTSLQWADVEAHINDVVVKLRPSMVGRSNELHVLMVQQRDYTRANEDKDTQELMAARIQSLRRRVGLNSNQVSIINTTDITDVSPAFIRLDAFFRERAAQYYRFHARRVKKFARQVVHRQKALHVRLCFKTAQFYEFCSLPDKSLVQLLSAFKALCALNMGPNNYDEVKGVAEMISFKVLHQYIRSGAARQAVAHFKTHMRWFRNAYGPTDLLYRHWAWVSRQYIIMGQLLHRYLPRVTRATDPYQTATYYYHAASLAAVKRQQAATALGISGAALVAPDVEHTVQPSPFVGALPLVTMLGKVPPTDIASLQWRCITAHFAAHEANVQHAAHVVNLVERAQALDVRDGQRGGGQSPMHKTSCFTFDLPPTASRIRLWRQSLVADQLLLGKQFAVVQKLLEPVAARYHQEGWWMLLEGVLQSLLTCAHELGDVDSYLRFSMQLMSRNLQGGSGIKAAVQKKFLLALIAPQKLGGGFTGAGTGAGAGVPTPTPPSTAPGGDAGSAGPGSDPEPPADGPRLMLPRRLLLPLDGVNPLLTASVGFVMRTARYGQEVELSATLLSHFPLPVHFARLTVEFSDPRYNRRFRDPTPLRTRRRAAALTAVGDDTDADLGAGESDDEGGAAAVTTPEGGDTPPSNAASQASGVTPQPELAGDVDLSLLPGCENDFTFTVPLEAPPPTLLSNGHIDPAQLTSPEALFAATNVVIELDLGPATGADGALTRRVVVFHVKPQAEAPGVGRALGAVPDAGPSHSFMRRLSEMPLHAKPASDDAASGADTGDDAGAGAGTGAGGSGSGGKGAPRRLSRQLSSLSTREDEGPYNSLLVLHPDTHMKARLRVEPLAALGGDTGAGGSTDPLLIGGIHRVTMTVDSGREACAGGAVFFEWGFGDPVLFGVATDSSPPGMCFDVALPQDAAGCADDRSACDRLRLVRIEAGTPVPLPAIAAHEAHTMTLFLRVPRAVSATLTARIVFATRHTCGNGDANEADSADESAGPEDVPADMAWPDIIRSQPHLSRRTSTSVRFTSITPLQASYELVRHGMLLDCDGLPGAEGSGLAGSAGSAALSLGRVCVNQPFLVYCRVVGNPKRPVTLTAVHLQLVDSGAVRVLSSPQEIQALVPAGGVELRQGDVFCVCVRLMVTRPCVDLKPGTVRLQWRSNCCTSVAASPLSTVVAFPPLSCTAPAIEGEFMYPSSAFVGEPFDMCLRLHNTTPFVQHLVANVAVPAVSTGVTSGSSWTLEGAASGGEPSATDPPAFVISGYRRKAMVIPPHSRHNVSIVAIPTRPGQFSLPGFSVTSPSKHLPLLTPSSAPAVYVFPSRSAPSL